MARSPEPETPTAVKKSRLPQVLVVVAGIASLAGFAALFSVWMQAAPPSGRDRLRLAQEQYLDGETIVAGKLAEQVELDPENEEDESWRALQAFLIGAGQVQRAYQAETEAERRAMMVEAIPILQDAAGLGFPAGREAEGHRLLGESLLQSGRFQDAANSLREAIQRDRTLESDWMPAIASAELHGSSAEPSRALETIESYLALPSINASQRRDGKLIQLEALLANGRWDEVDRLIQTSLANYNDADLAEQNELADYRDMLRLFDAQRQVDATIERFADNRPMSAMDDSVTNVDDAIARRERLLKIADRLSGPLRDLNRLHREAPPRLAARAKLLAAKAYEAQGDVAQAIAQLTTVRQLRPFGAEGIAASLREIELLAQQGRGVEMVQTTRYVMREVQDPLEFDGSLVPLEEFKSRLITAIEQLRLKDGFESAIDTSRSLAPLFSRSEALVQEGLGYRQWAESTLGEGRETNGTVNRAASQVARSRFRSAGEAFEGAAKLQINSNRYLPLLWSAIEAFQKGRHFSRSIELLEPYLRYEQRRRQPRGLIAYGRALLAEGEPERAIDALETCIIEFERDPLRYDARLMAALAALELYNKEVRNNTALLSLNDPFAVARQLATQDDKYLLQAKRLLRENLDDGDLRPDSPAWRNSLITLGNLLYDQLAATELGAGELSPEDQRGLVKKSEGTLQEAIRVLDEVVKRDRIRREKDFDWSSREADSAEYFLARCHRLSAHWAQIESNTPDMLDPARRALRVRSANELSSALAAFEDLRQRYEAYEEENRLNPNEDTMLRNGLVSEADTLLEMDRFADAATAYRAISLRYRDEPIALEAFLGQIECARQLGRSREAELLVQQAAVVLTRIPQELDPQFESMTRFGRTEWDRYLTWMGMTIASKAS